jgi:hypothetical protein
LESFLYVVDEPELGREDVLHDTVPIYYVSYPTGEDTQGIGYPVETSDLTSFIAEQGERWSCFSAKLLCDSTESELIPMTSASNSRNSSKLSLKAQASLVQPRVSSLG